MKKAKTKITDIKQLEELLPKHSYTKAGVPMEPINVVIIGNRRFIKQHLSDHGWYAADKIGALSLTKSMVAVVFNLSYPTGPMADSFLKGRRFAMAFEHPTKGDTYRRRHHLRIWQTPYKLLSRRVWAGTISYDRSAGAHDGILPTHHISPDLSQDEKYLATTLGVKSPHFLKMSHPYSGELNQGDPYIYDGRALVLDLG